MYRTTPIVGCRNSNLDEIELAATLAAMAETVQSALIFDVETFSPSTDSIDPHISEALTKQCQSEAERQEARQLFGLYAVAAQVACVGLFDPRRQRPAVFYRQDLGTIEKANYVEWEEEALEVNIQGFDGEVALLEALWPAIEQFDTIITFNGRNFDCPFLMHRSFILGVEVKRHLFSNRYNIRKHLDLCDYLSGFGASRRYSLDVWARSLRVKSPKDEGIDGSQVGELIKAGNIQAVANYCIGDVIATAKLAKAACKSFTNDLADFVPLFR